ncbi:MAG TPA: hypothetical protein VHF65_09470 [Nitrososphaera sp.]|jgi:hypothetical protein|nr:hypothetical protein [Nitrososphaera sp.]
MSHDRRWTVDNPEDQIRTANRQLHSRLMRIVSQRNLNSQLPRGDGSSILEIVDVLINNAIISREGQSRDYAEVITSIGDRVDRGGGRIAAEEFQKGDYTIAIAEFDNTLQNIENQSIDEI